MRKIRILGAQTHFKLKVDKDGKEICKSGPVDFYRIVQPLKNLPKDKFEVDIEYELFGNGSKYKNIDELTKHYDILYFSYIEMVELYLALRVSGIKNKMKVLIDLDDNIWAVHKTHPNYKDDFELGSENSFKRSAIMLDADAMTTTSQYLKDKIKENIKKEEIYIIPNYIDLTEFDYKRIKDTRDKKLFVIGYLGGTSHLPDLMKPEFIKALKIIMGKYENVRFRTCFYLPQLKALFGYKYEHRVIGTGEEYRHKGWPEMMGEFDVCVAPLSWSNYSRAKSYVKYLEYSAGKKPTICEDIEPYREVLDKNTDRGFLASTTDDWVKYFKYCIENPKEAEKIGENAYKYVSKYHTIQNKANIKRIADVFIDLHKKPFKKLTGK